MHDLNSEIRPDARSDFGWMRARARAACPLAGSLPDFARAMAAERAHCG
eukprot:COSAG05_NODE_6860_length_891_cov_1.905303_2_plen_48_part_01